MLTLVEQARVILIIDDFTSIDEVSEVTSFIYGYVIELTSDTQERKDMHAFLRKVAFHKIKEFLIEK